MLLIFVLDQTHVCMQHICLSWCPGLRWGHAFVTAAVSPNLPFNHCLSAVYPRGTGLININTVKFIGLRPKWNSGYATAVCRCVSGCRSELCLSRCSPVVNHWTSRLIPLPRSLRRFIPARSSLLRHQSSREHLARILRHMGINSNSSNSNQALYSLKIIHKCITVQGIAKNCIWKRLE